MVMLFVRLPLSLRNVEALLSGARHRCQPRDCALLVEPVWSVVRSRYSPTARVADEGLLPLELASRQDVREDLQA